MNKTLTLFALSIVFLISLGFTSAISIGVCSNDLNCPADTSCTNNYCAIATGTCASVQLSGVPCEGTGTCVNGLCSHSLTCDDENVCTIDSGAPGALCLHTPIDCSDGDSSTYDWCLSDIGCQNTLQPACYDENPCTTAQYLGYSCNIIDYSDFCDDKNPLTYDSCDLTSSDYTQWSCIHTPLPVCGNGLIEPGEECDDENAVNGDGCTTNCTIEENIIVPEFKTFIAMLTALSALGVFFIVRRSK